MSLKKHACLFNRCRQFCCTVVLSWFDFPAYQLICMIRRYPILIQFDYEQPEEPVHRFLQIHTY